MIFGYEVSRTWVSNMVRSDFVYHPLGQPQAQKGVGKWSPEALACTVLMPQPWILGKLFNILEFWINIIGIFWYHPQGRLQTHESVGILRLKALAYTFLLPKLWILEKLFNMLHLWIILLALFPHWLFEPEPSWRGVEWVKWKLFGKEYRHKLLL